MKTNTELQKKVELQISQNILYKIYRLCQTNNAVEWSGVLFYKVIKRNDKDITENVFEAVDLFLMDIGSSAYTEYEFDESVVGYLCDNPELMGEDYVMGHIHSHNNMDTFFSGTDMQELVDNAPNHNYYLSLIVNNKGDMCAKVAVNEKIEINSTELRKSIFGEKILKSNKTVNRMVDYDCKIILNVDTDFENRIVKIQTKKQQLTVSKDYSLHGVGLQLAIPSGEVQTFDEFDIIDFYNDLLETGEEDLESLFSFMEMVAEDSDSNINNIARCKELFNSFFEGDYYDFLLSVIEHIELMYPKLDKALKNQIYEMTWS